MLVVPAPYYLLRRRELSRSAARAPVAVAASCPPHEPESPPPASTPVPSSPRSAPPRFFGASTPVAKALVVDVHPVVLAALLYLGSGSGSSRSGRPRGCGRAAPALRRATGRGSRAPILFGGVLGPIALMLGLVSASGASASLLLNLEAVLTALIAWVVFRENADRRIVLGMALDRGRRRGARVARPTRPARTTRSARRSSRPRACAGRRQQSHAQGLGRGRDVHRGRQGTRRGGGQPRDWLASAASSRLRRPRPPRSRSVSSATA